MKTKVLKYNLAGRSQVFVVSLLALLRKTGLAGEETSGAIPAEVLDTLKIQLVSPNVTGAQILTTKLTRPCHYSVEGNELTIALGELTPGQHRLTVKSVYGTNTRSLLIVDVTVPVGDGETSEAINIDVAAVSSITPNDSEIVEDVGTLKGEMLEAQGAIEYLQNHMGAAEENVSTLQGQMTGVLEELPNKASKTELIEAIGESLDAVKQEMQSLPDGSAVSAQVALNTTDIEDLKDEVIYDVSAHNSGVAFASLSALLSDANLSTLIPLNRRAGGMSIRFKQGTVSENKYVQYFLTKNEWSTSEADWEKVNLQEDVSQLGQEVNQKVGENTALFAQSAEYPNQHRAYVYGKYKAGDKLIIRAYGTAATIAASIGVRYDDETTPITSLINNEEKEVILTQDTTFIEGIVLTSNITTPGTIYLSVIGSVSKEILEIKSNGYIAPSLINSAVASKTFKLSGEQEAPIQTYIGYILSYQNGGALTPVSGQNQFIVEEYSVTPFSTYRVFASKRYNNCVYTLLNVNNDVIRYVGSGDSSTQRIDGLIVMPFNAVKIRVAYDNTLNIGGLFTPAIEPISGAFGKKWIAIGDSLTEVNARATKNYLNYIAEKTGLVPVNMGLSGSGYRKLHDTNQAFYQRVSNMATDGDLITIFGSFNDLSVDNYDLGTPTDTGTTTICGCVNNTLDTILSVYLTAGKLPVIGVITPTPWGSCLPSDPSGTAASYCDAIIECCKRKSIPVLDLFRCSNLHPDNATFRTLAYSRDGGNSVHPDENGHKIIAPIIQEFIEQLIR